MSRDEFAAVCERVALWWPQRQWSDASAAAYFRDLADLPGTQVQTACEALYRTGREWPPNGAQVRNQVLELRADTPGFGEVWDRLLRAASRFGWRREDEAIAWLEDWCSLAGRLAAILPFREFCLTEELEVFHGQARRSWDQLTARAVRDGQVEGLPPAGLRAVARANGPRHIGDVVAGELPAPALRSVDP